MKHPKIKECLGCGALFEARRSYSSEDGLTKYCSPSCKRLHSEKLNNLICEYCGKAFTSYRKDRHCSEVCRKNNLKENNSPAYKGGYYIHSQSGVKMILITGKDSNESKRETYISEPRLVAGKAIGRPLMTSEVVVQINENPLDVNPSNLFICSIGTARKIKWGTYKGKLESNLDTYR